MKCFHVHDRLEGPPFGEHRGGATQQLFAPLADLVRMHIEALGQLGEGGLAFHGRQSDLRFERRRVVPTGTTGHGLSS